MTARILVHFDVVISKAALFIGQRAIDQLFELFDAERFESKNLRAGDQRAVHIKKRIVSGRANETEISGFYVGQQNVLLRFIKMMDLVDEQNRLLSGCPEAIRSRRDYAPHFGDVAFHAADSNEFRMRHLGNDARERCFPAAGRAGENH